MAVARFLTEGLVHGLLVMAFIHAHSFVTTRVWMPAGERMGLARVGLRNPGHEKCGGA